MEESWDSSELPTKFNKYKRLKEREAAATNGQHFQNFSSQQPSTSTYSSETSSVQPAPLADAVSSLTTWRSSDSPREQPNELCPDGLALKKRLVSVPQPGMTSIGNGCHLPFEDTPSSSQEYADCLRLGPHPGSSLLSSSFDGVVYRNRASPQQHTQRVGGSPRLVRLAGEQRLSECRCGACPRCVRPLSANSCSSQYHVRSTTTDVPHVYDAPLNLTVSSSSRSSQSTSHQWRHGTNNAEQQRYAAQTMPAPDNGSSRVVDEHFERSLGIGYARLVQNPTSASDNSAIDASKLGSRQTNASDCVDDHFSKSLGDLWPRVKDNGNTAAARHGVSDQFVSNVAKNSVDDHFTKALGAKTWNEIKASTEKTVSRYPT